jgi:hypothetical protein
MKRITKTGLILGILLFSYVIKGNAQDCGGYYYLTSNAGWTESDWYKIIDIDAATLTDAALPKFSASNGAENAVEADFNSGTFSTPVYTYNASTETYETTSISWPVKYYMAAFAPTMYTSAWSKINILGSNPSGQGTYVTCTCNDNSVKTSAIFDKPGFIELSRLAPTTTAPTVSRHGYIEIDDLPQVERIQWSYSSTSWKRGVKADINYNDGNGWQPLRWVASDYSIWEATFAEQGYQFEEVIGKQDDPDSKISVRFRIWDGDSIHYKVNPNDLSVQASTYTNVNYPLGGYAYLQTVRIHQIKVYSGTIPENAPNAVITPVTGQIGLTISDKKLNLSEISDVQLFGYDGRRIYNGTTDQIDISNISKGIYIIKATSSSGKSLTKKITL